MPLLSNGWANLDSFDEEEMDDESDVVKDKEEKWQKVGSETPAVNLMVSCTNQLMRYTTD